VGVFTHGAGTSAGSAVYTDMRRTTLLIVSLLLAVPALAHAKAGVEFDQDPELAPVGTAIGFTVMAFREPRGPSGPSSGEPRPVVGAHPLVTFRSESGRVIRVRASETNLNGIGYGKVRFTDKGPWLTEMHVRGVHVGDEFSQPINAGAGLTQTTPPTVANDPAPSKPDDDFPWVWILSGASILAALLVAGMRRRGHWRTA
jgi:hypothetical protein